MKTLWVELPIQYLLQIQHNHWLQYHRISPSISYKICKKLMVDVNFNIRKFKSNVQIINKFIDQWCHVQTKDLMSIKSERSESMQNQNDIQIYFSGIEWVNSLIFNVIAINDQYKQQISQSFSISSHNGSSNPQVSIQIADNLQQSWSQSIQYLLAMPNLCLIISNVCPLPKFHKNIGSPAALLHRNLHELQYTLLTTISYMCEKLQINLGNKEEIQQKIQMLNQCSCQCWHSDINPEVKVAISSLLFGQLNNEYDINKFEQLFCKNYNCDLIPICSIVDANYYKFQTIRPLFLNTKITGADFIHHCIMLMIGSYSKNQLFSEAMFQNDRILQLLLAIMEYRHLQVYAHWNYCIKNLIQMIRSQQNTSPKIKEISLQNIKNFLYSLPIEHQQFINIFSYIYAQLIKKKFSKNTSVDIIKKLLLNRFLLNPNLYFKYLDANYNIGSEQIAIIFNRLRLLFYPRKLQNNQHPSIFTIPEVEQIQNILISVINDTNTSTRNKNKAYFCLPEKCVVYQLDRSLYQDYSNLYHCLFQNYASSSDTSSQPKSKGRNSSYQLSFSFVKNISSHQKQSHGSKQINNKKFIMQTPQENKSLNTIVEYLQSNNNIKQFGSPTSQKSRKTVHTQISDGVRQDDELRIIQELVIRRRTLGMNIKRINQRRQRKRKQLQKFNCYFSKIWDSFNKIRRQIQNDCNRIRIDIQLI